MSATSIDIDRFYMKRALRLAAKGLGYTSPNPVVGAVAVQGDEIVGEGYHEYLGGAHGEINALKAAGPRAKGATLYVTLEPCTHFGRTPPCTNAILDAKIGRVVIGMSDPNPKVAGGGADRLRNSGVSVLTGVLEGECRGLNQPFIKYVTTGLPFVTLKAAATLDGRIAARTGDSRWVSNERSRHFVHHLRCVSDGILVGIETALHDDPQLTARVAKRRGCRQPVRIILDTRLRLPNTCNLVKTAHDTPLWVVCGEEASSERESELVKMGAEVVRLPSNDEVVDISRLLCELGRRQITSLLVEGGARVLGAFLERRLADDFHFFYAPKILADPQGVPMFSGQPRPSIAEAVPTHNIKVRRFGEDVLLSGMFRTDLY